MTMIFELGCGGACHAGTCTLPSSVVSASIVIVVECELCALDCELLTRFPCSMRTCLAYSSDMALIVISLCRVCPEGALP